MSFPSRLLLPARPRHVLGAWILLSVALSLSAPNAVLAAAAAPPTPAAQPFEEHLPRRAKPPAVGVRPSALPAYGARLGVPALFDADRQFARIVDEFLLFHFRNQPIRATNVGVHEFDAALPATDSVAIETSIADLGGFLARLARLEVDRLGRERRFDHAMR